MDLVERGVEPQRKDVFTSVDISLTSGDGAGPGRFVFDTAHLPIADQFEAWRQLNTSAIDLSGLADGARDFAARQSVWDLGGLVYTHAALPAGTRREWGNWKHRPLDHWCLVLPNPLAARPGERVIGFRSLGQPFQGSADDGDVHTLYVPRSLFGGHASILDRVDPDIADNGLGALLADYLLNVYRRLPEMKADELPRLTEATRAMIIACALPSRDRLHEVQGVISETVFERARQIVEHNLLSPELGADFLSRELGLSRSHLYRMFERHGGVKQFIQRRRLQDAHTALSNPANSSRIQEIGEARGFQDAASFSRAFRREFGYAPSEARGASRPHSTPLPLALPTAAADSLGRLGTLLSAL